MSGRARWPAAAMHAKASHTWWPWPSTHPTDPPPPPKKNPPDYMSPEVVSLPTADERKKLEQAGQKAPDATPYTEKVDIWAAGILAYELLIGKPPYEVANEVDTRKRILYETTLTFPPSVSADAISFIKTALAKNAAMRPDAAAMLRHPWVRPYLAAAVAAGAGGSGVGALLVGDSMQAAIAALRTAAPSAANSASSSNTAGLVRSASFSVPSATAAAAGRPAGLAVPGDELLNSQLLHHMAAGPGAGCSSSLSASPLSGVSRPLASPTASDAPATPGPWVGGRKPVWEADRSPSAFTAVRTAGLGGEVGSPGPASPSSGASPGAATSPGRSKLAAAGPGALAAAAGPIPGGCFSGGAANPLLKAALNSSLYGKLSHTTQQQGQHAGGVPAGRSAGSNVKSRIKEYFVARANNNEATGGGGTLT